ncbi:MAG: hypothetical protein Q8N83_15165 [Ignavibacteria bacterium]|nr:hypothetical protein [Ignavibacteria bacterium]
MRYLQLFIFLLALVFSSATAQSLNATSVSISDTSMQASSGEEEVDVAGMVDKQIAIAQAKQWENKVQPVVQQKNVSSISKNEIESNWFVSFVTWLGLSPETLIRIEIILVSALLVFGSVVTRRLVLKRKGKSNKLRSNIQSLRLEKSVVKKETKLKNIRENLLKSSIYLSNAEGSLTQKAKELNIAKGEIILAAKIKSYELSICSNER